MKVHKFTRVVGKVVLHLLYLILIILGFRKKNTAMEQFSLKVDQKLQNRNRGLSFTKFAEIIIIFK